MKTIYRTLLAVAAIAAAPLSAHHSPIIFDTDSVVVLQGQISRYDWANPHSYIFVEAVNDNGETTEWQLETDATPILQRTAGPRSRWYRATSSRYEPTRIGELSEPMRC